MRNPTSPRRHGLLVLRASALVPAHAVGARFLGVCTLIGTGSFPLHPGAVPAYRALHGWARPHWPVRRFP